MQLSVQHGVDAIALSNHGGRQLDDAPNPIDLVQPVFNAVGGQVGTATEVSEEAAILSGNCVGS